MSLSEKAILEEISQKIKRLKARNSRLELENKELRESVFDYLKQLESSKNEGVILNQQLTSSLIVSNSKELSKIKREIDKHIKLVDQCIAFIKNK